MESLKAALKPVITEDLIPEFVGTWINGKLVIEHDKTINRGGGEQPYGAFITREMFDEFRNGQVTIAVTSFIRYNDKRDAKTTEKIPQGIISIHFEEQALPPMGDDLVRQSAKVFSQISFQSDGTTSHPAFLWSGDHLMELNRYQALRGR